MLSTTELHIRAALLRAIRSFFTQQEFLEVDTPLRQRVILPESNIRALRAGEQYLQTSPESCMKRLLARGCSRIFQISPCFRKEEKGRRHLEEFTMLEWYRSNATYEHLMDDCLELLKFLAETMAGEYPELGRNCSSISHHQGENGAVAYQKITVAEAFSRWSPIGLDKALAEGNFDEILVEHIEPHLGIGEVAFLIDYPASMASLAKRKDDDLNVAERFELYLQGVEIANGFSELIDPVEQRSRFQKEIETIFDETGERMAMPEKFLTALDHLADCAGIALGIDRLFMLILGKNDINEAITFSPKDL